MNPRIYTVVTSHMPLQREWSIIDSIKTTLPGTLRETFESFDHHGLYRFNLQGAYTFNLLGEYYPREYEVLKEAVKLGRLVPSGSFWEPSELRIPSDEALMRNIYYGNAFYLKEYNRSSEGIFLPDQQVIPEDLPRLLSHMNMKAMTLLEESKELSSETGFLLGELQSKDGSKVYLGIGKRKEAPLEESLSSKESETHEKVRLRVFMPTEGDLLVDDKTLEVIEKDIARGSDVTTGIRVISAKTDEFYHPLKDLEPKVFKGFLGSNDKDAGLLTMASELKMLNREAESLLLDTERLGASVSVLEYDDPRKNLEEGWKFLLSHHGYDDLGGNLSKEARRITLEDWTLALNKASSSMNEAMQYGAHYLDTSQEGAPVVVFNPLERKRKEMLHLQVPEGDFGVFDSLGREVMSQSRGEKLTFMADVKAMGLRVYYVRPKREEKASRFFHDEEKGVFTSDSLSIMFNDEGELYSLFDKELQKELLGGPMSLMHYSLDEKDLGLTAKILKTGKKIDGKSRAKVLSEGELFMDIGVDVSYESSELHYTYRLYHDKKELDVFLEVDWNEEASFLRILLPSAFYSKKATYLTDGTPMVRRMDEEGLSSFSKGAMLLSDGSHSLALFSVAKSGYHHPEENILALDLLYDPKRLEQGKLQFNWSMKGFKGYHVPREELLYKKHPLRAYYTEHHSGPLGAHVSFLEVLTEGVELRAFKHSETTDHLLIRVQETEGSLKEEVKISFLSRILIMQEVDGAENLIPSKSMIKGNVMTFELKPYEMKSYLVKLKRSSLGEEPLITEPMTLILNKNFYSPEGSNKLTKMIPLELARESIKSEGITFNFYPEPIESAMTLTGQRMSLSEGYDRLHMLVASLKGPKELHVEVDGERVSLLVGSFYGTTQGLRPYETMGFISTHLHSEEGNLIHEKGVMYHHSLKGKKFKFPEDKDLLVFAASCSRGYEVSPANFLFITPLKGEHREEDTY